MSCLNVLLIDNFYILAQLRVPLRSVSGALYPLQQWELIILSLGQTNQELLDNLLDIHNQRLTKMDQNGIDFVCLFFIQPIQLP